MSTELSNNVRELVSRTVTLPGNSDGVRRTPGVGVDASGPSPRTETTSNNQVTRLNPPDERSIQSDPEQLTKAVEKLNEHVQSVQRDLQFSLSETTNRVVVKVIARDSGDLIRQIPAEEVLAIAERIAEQSEEMQGSLLRVEV